MTKIIWIVLVLFVIGNSFFVLPYHFTKNYIANSYVINYKKDSALLHLVFANSVIPLKLNMPPSYNALYYNTGSTLVSDKQPNLVVNVSFLDNLDFFSLMFPFYKSINIKGDISFYSIMKIGDEPGRDSMALIGNINAQVWLSVKGVCTPLYVRTLVEQEFVEILKHEMDRVEKDINRRDTVDIVIENKPDNISYPRKRARGRQGK